MNKQILDRGNAEISISDQHVLNEFGIGPWYIEPYQDNQNFAENWYAIINATPNRVKNFSDEPAHTWMLGLL